MLVHCQEMLVEHQFHLEHRFLNALGRQLAFPNDDDLPAIIVQHLVILLVALLVPFDLVHPKIPIRLRNLATRTINYQLTTINW